jgi:hypothetical protein
MQPHPKFIEGERHANAIDQRAQTSLRLVQRGQIRANRRAGGLSSQRPLSTRPLPRKSQLLILFGNVSNLILALWSNCWGHDSR